MPKEVEHSVAHAMSRDLATLEPAASLGDAARLMDKRHIAAVLVVEGERLIGIVTERDVTRAVAAERVEGSSVADWMTQYPETIEPSESMSQAALLMIHGGFRHLPVVEGEALVGMLSIRDVVRVVLDDEAPRGV